MRHSCRISENRELLTITYKNDMIFEMKSATLKPSACVEMGRVANMISLFPDMAVHVEVGLDTKSPGTNGQLIHRRVQAVKDALLREGIDASRIQTSIDRLPPTLGSDNTMSFKVVDCMMGNFKTNPNRCRDGSQYRYQAL